MYIYIIYICIYLYLQIYRPRKNPSQCFVEGKNCSPKRVPQDASDLKALKCSDLSVGLVLLIQIRYRNKNTMHEHVWNLVCIPDRYIDISL